MENLINIDLAPLCGVANNLIDKLSSGIGWVVTHDTPDRLAQKTYIEEIQNSDFSPLVKAAMISEVNKTIKEYVNQVNIVKVAIDNMNSDARPNDVEDDWLWQFMDRARLVSDEQFQVIWGHILKEECNAPNSIPKTLLHILSQMDRIDAESFSVLCSLSVYVSENGVKEFTPIVVASHLNDYYAKIGINYEILSNLQSLGLIEMSVGFSDNVYEISVNKKPINIRYFDEVYIFPEYINYFKCGNVIYTKAGNALCRALNAEKKEGFFQEQCVPIWKKQMEQNTVK